MLTNDINETIKRKPNGLWQWLISLGKPEVGDCIAGFIHKYQEEINTPFLKLRQGKDVLIINNAETLGSNDTKSLMELTEKTNARMMFLRDISIRQGFGAGNPIETIKHIWTHPLVKKFFNKFFMAFRQSSCRHIFSFHKPVYLPITLMT